MKDIYVYRSGLTENTDGVAPADIILGTEDNDVLVGFGSKDQIYGFGGDDVLWGRGNNDALDGGDGNDHLYGEQGKDGLFGGAGNDFLYGDIGADYLEGGEGDDWLSGGADADNYGFIGNAGHDTIIESLSLGDSIEFADGILASDLIVTRIRSGADDDEFDLTLKIKGTDDQVTILDQLEAADGSGIESIVFSDGTVWDKATILSHIVATNDANYLDGTEAADTLSGLGGDDQVHGRGGDDVLYGGSGVDYLIGEGGNDKLVGGDDADGLIGGDGKDTMIGGSGDDIFWGGTGRNTMNGGSGADSFGFSGPFDSSLNVGTIVDFNPAEDVIWLDTFHFSKLSVTYPGSIPDEFFVASKTGKALESDDYILYDTDSGKLYYDADGNGAGAKVLFGIIGNLAPLTADDFVAV